MIEPSISARRLPRLNWGVAGILLVAAALSADAQDRPLRSPDAEIVPAGTLRASVGFDFLQDVTFPLSGLAGDLTSVGIVNLRIGLGRIIEVGLDGAAQNYLDIRHQGASFVPLQLPSVGSTHDVGDFSLSTKIRIFGENGRPALAVRFGFTMPNSNQARGIGTNTTSLFAHFIVEKHFANLKLFGNTGLAILQAPNALYSQNDVLLYGGAFSHPLYRRVNLVGEVAGRYSARAINAGLLGTESRGQARLGLRFSVGGFQWDFAGIAGVNRYDPHTGFTFGVTKDIRLFTSGKAQ